MTDPTPTPEQQAAYKDRTMRNIAIDLETLAKDTGHDMLVLIEEFGDLVRGRHAAKATPTPTPAPSAPAPASAAPTGGDKTSSS